MLNIISLDCNKGCKSEFSILRRALFKIPFQEVILKPKKFQMQIIMMIPPNTILFEVLKNETVSFYNLLAQKRKLFRIEIGTLSKYILCYDIDFVTSVHFFENLCVFLS